jgi:hypothetical protein
VVITRRDLPQGLQVAQSVHASIGFCLTYPDLSRLWNEKSNYIVCLSAKDESELNKLILKCEYRGLEHYIFREPDIGNEITSIAIEPSKETQKIVSNLPLTLKQQNHVTSV